MCAVVLCLAVSAAAAAPQSTGAVERARRQFEEGHYEESARTLESAVSESPQDDAVYYGLGRARFELRDYTGAIEALKHAAELRAQNSEYHRWLGRAYGEQADRERSFSLARHVRDQFEEAVRLDPSNIAARRDLLEFYLDAPRILGGGREKGWSQAAAIAVIDPVAGHLARAVCWARQGKGEGTSGATSEYKAVLDAKPRQVEPYLEAAVFYEKQKDPAGLRAAVEGADAVKLSAPELAYFRGVLNVIAGRKSEDAEASLKMYLSAVPPRSDRPSHASAHEWLGRLYESLGQPALAAAEYRNALALDPRRESARQSLRRLGQ